MFDPSSRIYIPLFIKETLICCDVGDMSDLLALLALCIYYSKYIKCRN